jgi:cell division protein FtsZ
MLFEVEQAANRIRAEVDPDANIIFGNTILDDMEGRIRVSVVATGIDVVEQKLPDKVQPLRAHVKPTYARPEVKPDARFEPRPEARPAEVRQASLNPASSNQVHRQHETIAEEMGAAPVARHAVTETEAAILGEDEDTRSMEEKYPVTVTVRPIPQPRPDLSAPLRAEPEERRLFGFLGRKKPREEVRVEPAQRSLVAPRANAQVVQRQQPVETPRQQTAAPASQPEDLFPDHKRDEQFEIPAFLRRQTN